MSVGGGAGDVLKVDAPLVEQLGGELEASAGGLPDAPPPFVVSGVDAISEAIAFRLPGIEGPIQEGLPQVKADATKTAGNIVSAAGKYQATDEQVAANYEKHQFDQAGGPAASGSGGGSGGDAMSQMGQMMGMPMQMAQQAMGAVASVPQSVMQGVQQISQVTAGLGKGGEAGQSSEPGPEQAEDRQAEDRPREDERQGAASGESKGERAPDSTASEAPTQVNPPAPQPSPSGPRHAAPDPSVNL